MAHKERPLGMFHGLSNHAVRSKSRLVSRPRFGPRVRGTPTFRAKSRFTRTVKFDMLAWYARKTGVRIHPHPESEGSSSRSVAARKAWRTRRGH